MWIFYVGEDGTNSSIVKREVPDTFRMKEGHYDSLEQAKVRFQESIDYWQSQVDEMRDYIRHLTEEDCEVE